MPRSGRQILPVWRSVLQGLVIEVHEWWHLPAGSALIPDPAQSTLGSVLSNPC